MRRGGGSRSFMGPVDAAILGDYYKPGGRYITPPLEAFSKGGGAAATPCPADELLALVSHCSLITVTSSQSVSKLLLVRSAPTRSHHQRKAEPPQVTQPPRNDQKQPKEFHMRRNVVVFPFQLHAAKGMPDGKGPDPCNGSGSISDVNAGTSAPRRRPFF